MRMLNDCLEVTAAKRAELMASDNRSRERELRMIKEPIRPRAYGNRAQRRAAKVIQRKKEHA